MTSLIRPTDDEARRMAQALLRDADHAVIGVLDPDTGAPSTSRIALAQGPDGTPISWISQLSAHSQALTKDNRCSLLVGDPGPKGDPLTHPRLTVQATAQAVGRDDAEFPKLRDHYAKARPKSKLYIDFADFYLVAFRVSTAFLNGGFGKAFVLTPDDLDL